MPLSPTFIRQAPDGKSTAVSLGVSRAAWATPERFPTADEIHIMHADDYLKGHPLSSNAYVAVLSHDPKLDDPALFGALQSDARYVGSQPNLEIRCQ